MTSYEKKKHTEIRYEYKGGEYKEMTRKGFTLIELLIVIAILGTLAVVVLLALNPVQQLARTRDSGRQSTVTQLGHAMAAYATVNGGVYPTASSTWIDDYLVDTGEISSAPQAVTYSTGDATGCGGQDDWCYASDGDSAVVYAEAEATSNRAKCGTAASDAYFVYSTFDGRGGLVCSTPSAGSSLTYVD